MASCISTQEKISRKTAGTFQSPCCYKVAVTAMPFLPRQPINSTPKLSFLPGGPKDFVRQWGCFCRPSRGTALGVCTCHMYIFFSGICSFHPPRHPNPRPKLSIILHQCKRQHNPIWKEAGGEFQNGMKEP